MIRAEDAPALAGWSQNPNAPIDQRLAASSQALDFYIELADRWENSVWNEVLAERVRAHRKHGDDSIESSAVGDLPMLAILVEEIGEVAHALTYDGPTEGLADELIQVMAVCSAWLDKVREGGPSLEFVNALQKGDD